MPGQGAPMPGQGAPAYGMYGGAGVQQPQQPVQSAAPEKKKAGPKYSDLAKRSVKEQAPVDPQQLASVANTVRQCIDAGVLRLQQSGKLGIRANQRQMESCKKRLQVLYQKLEGQSGENLSSNTISQLLTLCDSINRGDLATAEKVHIDMVTSDMEGINLKWLTGTKIFLKLLSK